MASDLEVILPEVRQTSWVTSGDVKTNPFAERGIRLHQIVQKAMVEKTKTNDVDPAIIWFFDEAERRGWRDLTWREEVALGDGAGQLRFIDLLHQPEGQGPFILLELKTGHPKDEHVAQLQDYLDLVGRSAEGYLCYLDRQEVVALGP
jgi:hypothetical protein